MHKKIALTLAGAMAAGLLLSGCSGSGTTVSVQSVGLITGTASAGAYDRYAGVVESGDTIEIQKNENMTVKEVKVKTGDTVKTGQVLFVYDTESMNVELEKQQLELEQLKNTITTKNDQITALQKEKQSAGSSEQLDYTIQIQELQVDVKEAEYNVTAKGKEIERTKAVLENAEVTATVDGTVQSINTDGSTSDDGTAKPFMTITQSGDYRIKGNINEQNKGSLSQGQAVIIRSRTDESVTWSGTVDTIDWDHPVSGDNSGVVINSSDSSDTMTSSSKYPFYIKLSDDDGLMLGQHVYIEPDYGQDSQQAFSLSANFIVDPDGDAYVWAAGSGDKLEKRSVKLGEYDEALDSYQILDGLSAKDYIADPSEDCKEGAPVSYYSEDSFSTDATNGGEEPIVDAGNGGDSDGIVTETAGTDAGDNADTEGVITDSGNGETVEQGTEAAG
jgi:HlyD family secretion protein